jgi:hypothetical protein
MICIAAVPPGGLAQTHYLCKRLRARSRSQDCGRAMGYRKRR